VADSETAQGTASSAAETSVSGLSEEFMEAVRAYAKSRNEKLRVVYDEAISDMVDRINGGEEVFFPAVVARQKWKARHIRLSPEIKDLLMDTCGKLRVHKSVFFHKALRDYLTSKGIAAPD
jgi:predicted transcriptional regulator